MPDPDQRGIALGAIGWAVENSEKLWPGVSLVGNHLVYSELTPHQIRVIEAASHGMTNNDIAEILGVSLESVKHHLKNASRILKAKNRAHLVANAMRGGLIR